MVWVYRRDDLRSGPSATLGVADVCRRRLLEGADGLKVNASGPALFVRPGGWSGCDEMMGEYAVEISGYFVESSSRPMAICVSASAKVVLDEDATA